MRKSLVDFQRHLLHVWVQFPFRCIICPFVSAIAIISQVRCENEAQKQQRNTPWRWNWKESIELTWTEKPLPQEEEASVNHHHKNKKPRYCLQLHIRTKILMLWSDVAKSESEWSWLWLKEKWGCSQASEQHHSSEAGGWQHHDSGAASRHKVENAMRKEDYVNILKYLEVTHPCLDMGGSCKFTMTSTVFPISDKAP